MSSPAAPQRPPSRRASRCSHGPLRLRCLPAGVMQRVVRSPVFAPEAAQSLCFHPLPESQPVLPCLLRRLLQKGRYEDALELARCGSSL